MVSGTLHLDFAVSAYFGYAQYKSRRLVSEVEPSLDNRVSRNVKIHQLQNQHPTYHLPPTTDLTVPRLNVPVGVSLLPENRQDKLHRRLALRFPENPKIRGWNSGEKSPYRPKVPLTTPDKREF